MTATAGSHQPSLGLLGSEQALAQAYDVALLDLDGVCFAGQARIDHAAQGVNGARAAGMRLSFVTNNASRAPRTVADKLGVNSIEAYPNEVFSAAMDAAALLGEHVDPGSPVLVIGGDGLRQALLDEGYRLVDSAEDHPVAVVQGWAPEVDWAMMSEGVYAIRDGAIHVATNTDATLPTERGFALGNGSLVVAVANASGKEYLAGGKPFPGIYRRALARAGGSRPLAVGDRLDTDLVGARAAGIAGMHVLTGVSTARDVVLAPAEQRPTYLHTDLRGLLEPHPAPQAQHDGWWRVRDWTARVDQGTAFLHGPQGGLELRAAETTSLPLDAYRALACAVWEQRDLHGPAGAPALPVLSVTAPEER
ncbi:HAD-IIA family hydrolase [Actinomyces faecalis]|uniref:HAD-IIA family hydrolase n=1 Tax=Actinomyces faecalis TaxID=2722820 RepID=UPI001551FA60|nr:HAD hydrolase-like protein [Actinomyces faecalis]